MVTRISARLLETLKHYLEAELTFLQDIECALYKFPNVSPLQFSSVPQTVDFLALQRQSRELAARRVVVRHSIRRELPTAGSLSYAIHQIQEQFLSAKFQSLLNQLARTTGLLRNSAKQVDVNCLVYGQFTSSLGLCQDHDTYERQADSTTNVSLTHIEMRT